MCAGMEVWHASKDAVPLVARGVAVNLAVAHFVLATVVGLEAGLGYVASGRGSALTDRSSRQRCT